MSTPVRVVESPLPPVAAAVRAKPSSVLLAPSKDNTLYEVEEGFLSNGSGQHFFSGKRASGPVRRAVVAFDPGWRSTCRFDHH